MPQKNVYIPEDEDKEIDELSEFNKKAYSDMILQIIKSGIKEEKKKTRGEINGK